MSNKTFFKRLATVLASALTLGVMTSISPASADGDRTFATDATSYTVVSAQTDTALATAVVRITVSDIGAAGANIALPAGDTITASVVGVPTSVAAKTLGGNASDLVFLELKRGSANAFVADTPASGSTTDGAIGSLNTAHSDSATTAANSVYFLGVRPYTTTNTVGFGEYTVRLTLTDSAGFVFKTQDLKFNFVSSAASSGAKITITQTGSVTAGAAYSNTTANRTSVALTDANSGKLQSYASTTTALTPDAPTLAADIVDKDGISQTTGAVTTPILIADAGVPGQDLTSTTTTQSTIDLAFKNGTYGIYTTQTTAFDTAVVTGATAGQSLSWRVRYGSTQATAAVTVNSAASAVLADSTVGLTATGSFPMATNTGLSNYGNQWTLPLTTKSAVLTVRAMNSTTAVQNYPIVFTVTWTSVSEGDVSPRTGATYATTVRTDSSGYAKLTLTNNSPIDGAQASVAIGGLNGTATAQRVLWQKSKPTTVTSSPNANYAAAVKSTNTITWTFTDTFGAPVAGEVIDFSISGANSATSTVVIPSATTDANGVVSYTFTDAAGVEDSTTLGTTTVTATARSATSVTLGRTITWKATVPVIATLSGFYNENEGTSGAASYSDVVPTTVIYDTAASATGFLINTSNNLTRSLAIAGDQGDQVAFRYIARNSAAAAVTGVPVTVSVSDGLHLISGAGLPVSSRTIYPATGGFVDFIVLATKTGTHKITVTAGAVSATAQIAYENASTDARYVTITGATTGTANSDVLPLATATVTDRWGNPVSGITLNATHTGVGRLSSGGKSQQFTTGANGAYTFELTSTAAGTASVSVTATNPTNGQLDDVAGYVNATELVDAITAGVATATHTVTFAAGTNASAAAAEAATDAALEAIDAANAATDAANLAAEAADAATVAAEEARDAADAATAAVEALASEVATLIAGLKAQITTLANTVAKIAKKVRA